MYWGLYVMNLENMYNCRMCKRLGSARISALSTHYYYYYYVYLTLCCHHRMIAALITMGKRFV